MANVCELAEAEQRYRAIAPNATPTKVAGFFWGYANGARGAGDYAKAREAADKAVEHGPKLGFAHFVRGTCLLESNDIRGAVESFRTATRLNPSSAEFLRGLGRAHWVNGEHDEAMAAFREALRRSPGNVGISDDLTNVCVAAGKPQLAEQWARETALSDPTDSTKLHRAGGIFWYRGKYDEAIRYVEESLVLSPNLGGLMVLGFICADAGDVERAEKCFGEALSISSEEYRAHNGIGLCHLLQGRREMAVLSLLRSAKLSRAALSDAHLGAALADRPYADALAFFQANVPRDAGDTEAQFAHAYAACRLAQGDLEAALTAVRAASGLYQARGVVLRAAGQTREAIAELRAAIRPGARLERAHLELALAYLESGRFDAALRKVPAAEAETLRNPDGGFSHWYLWQPRHASLRRVMRESELYAKLEVDFDEIRSGKRKPADATEALDFAKLCFFKGAPEAATRLFAQARPTGVDRLFAARAAAEAGKFTQAAAWFKAELSAMQAADVNPARWQLVTSDYAPWQWACAPELAKARTLPEWKPLWDALQVELRRRLPAALRGR